MHQNNPGICKQLMKLCVWINPLLVQVMSSFAQESGVATGSGFACNYCYLLFSLQSLSRCHLTKKTHNKWFPPPRATISSEKRKCYSKIILGNLFIISASNQNQKPKTSNPKQPKPTPPKQQGRLGNAVLLLFISNIWSKRLESNAIKNSKGRYFCTYHSAPSLLRMPTSQAPRG